MMEIFERLYDEFFERLEVDNPFIKENLEQQIEFRDKLFKLAEHIKKNKKEKFAMKKETLKKAISRGGEFDMVQFDKPKPMPLDPEIYVRGIDPTQCFVFKSAMVPLKLTFHA